MRAIRSRDTKPELAIRRELHRRGYRYTVDVAPLAGFNRRADIVFSRTRVAIFVDGCFWHGCPQHGRTTFNYNGGYWSSKLAKNKTRDADTVTQLQAAGWEVLRVWEHEEALEAADTIARIVDARSRALIQTGKSSRDLVDRKCRSPIPDPRSG